MNSFKKILVIFIFFSLCSAYADNHDKNSELIEQVKEVTENLENNLTEEEDVPLNDPFAGNEGTSGNASINLDTGEERDEMSIDNFTHSGIISGQAKSNVSLTNSSNEVLN